MRVVWLDDRCVLCLRRPDPADRLTARSDAHVIPQSVGGRLSAFILCVECNAKMGQLEDLLRQDVSLRALVDQLEPRLPPKMVKTIRRGQRYFAEHPEMGRLEAVIDNDGDLIPLESASLKGDDHTIAQAMADLDRLGESEQRKCEMREAFRKALPGEWVVVRPGYRIRKHVEWAGVSFKRAFNDPISPLSISAGIAYLYLALCLGPRVYAASLQPVRDALLAALEGDSKAAEGFNLNRHGTRLPKPIYELRAKPDRGSTVVTVNLLNDLIWPVRLPGPVNPEQTLYTLILPTGEETWLSKGPAP
jgi:HNH endonuclease